MIWINGKEYSIVELCILLLQKKGNVLTQETYVNQTKMLSHMCFLFFYAIFFMQRFYNIANTNTLIGEIFSR